MTASALITLLKSFESAAIPIWLDGGWGVDALLQTQTRIHKDVDIVIALSNVPRLRELLTRKGFTVQEGKPPDSFVMADETGLAVDIHAVRYDEAGNGVYRMQNGENWIYPAEGFSGAGQVEGMRVRCLSPRTQVLCHAEGYVPVEKDLRDMELLAERFEIELPPQLRGNQSNG